MLQLEAWCLGVKMYPEEGDTVPLQYYFHWDEKSTSITIYRGHDEVQPLVSMQSIRLDSQIQDLKVSPYIIFSRNMKYLNKVMHI